jgi:hypothetical protein
MKIEEKNYGVLSITYSNRVPQGLDSLLISTDIDCRNIKEYNNDLLRSVLVCVRARGGALGETLRLNQKVAGSIPNGVTGIFH